MCDQTIIDFLAIGTLGFAFAAAALASSSIFAALSSALLLVLGAIVGAVLVLKRGLGFAGGAVVGFGVEGDASLVAVVSVLADSDADGREMTDEERG